jgi:hypothetical protein
MKKFALSLMVVLLSFTMAQAANYEVVKKAGDYSVTIKLDKASPGVGPNAIEAVIKDAQGKAVTDAAVVFEYSMPAMPGMPAMNYKANGKRDGDAYKASMNLSMSGPWTIAVKFTKGGKTQSAKISIDVR